MKVDVKELQIHLKLNTRATGDLWNSPSLRTRKRCSEELVGVFHSLILNAVDHKQIANLLLLEAKIKSTQMRGYYWSHLTQKLFCLMLCGSEHTFHLFHIRTIPAQWFYSYRKEEPYTSEDGIASQKCYVSIHMKLHYIENLCMCQENIKFYLAFIYYLSLSESKGI